MFNRQTAWKELVGPKSQLKFRYGTAESGPVASVCAHDAGENAIQVTDVAPGIEYRYEDIRLTDHPTSTFSQQLAVKGDQVSTHFFSPGHSPIDKSTDGFLTLRYFSHSDGGVLHGPQDMELPMEWTPVSDDPAEDEPDRMMPDWTRDDRKDRMIPIMWKRGRKGQIYLVNNHKCSHVHQMTKYTQFKTRRTGQKNHQKRRH